MGNLLLILFIVFVVIPLARLAWAIFKARRQAQRFFRSFNQQTGHMHQERQNGYRRQQKKRTSAKRGKIISRDTGEYVSFEELPPQNDRCDVPPRNIVVEEQVVDVEWEDIR